MCASKCTGMTGKKHLSLTISSRAKEAFTLNVITLLHTKATWGQDSFRLGKQAAGTLPISTLYRCCITFRDVTRMLVPCHLKRRLDFVRSGTALLTKWDVINKTCSAVQWLLFLLSGEPQLGYLSVFFCTLLQIRSHFLNHLKVSSQDCVSGPLLIPWPSSRILIFPGLESWLAYSPCLDFSHPRGTFCLFSDSTILSRAITECGIIVLYCV